MPTYALPNTLQSQTGSITFSDWASTPPTSPLSHVFVPWKQGCEDWSPEWEWPEDWSNRVREFGEAEGDGPTDLVTHPEELAMIARWMENAKGVRCETAWRLEGAVDPPEMTVGPPYRRPRLVGFHGTSQEAIDSITHKGFHLPDRPGLLGWRVYLSPDCSKSAPYSLSRGCDRMLLCHFDPGRMVVVDKREGWVEGKEDTIKAIPPFVRSTPAEYGVRDPVRVTPAYIVQFSTRKSRQANDPPMPPPAIPELVPALATPPSVVASEETGPHRGCHCSRPCQIRAVGLGCWLLCFSAIVTMLVSTISCFTKGKCGKSAICTVIRSEERQCLVTARHVPTGLWLCPCREARLAEANEKLSGLALALEVGLKYDCPGLGRELECEVKIDSREFASATPTAPGAAGPLLATGPTPPIPSPPPTTPTAPGASGPAAPTEGPPTSPGGTTPFLPSPSRTPTEDSKHNPLSAPIPGATPGATQATPTPTPTTTLTPLATAAAALSGGDGTFTATVTSTPSPLPLYPPTATTPAPEASPTHGTAGPALTASPTISATSSPSPLSTRSPTPTGQWEFRASVPPPHHVPWTSSRNSAEQVPQSGSVWMLLLALAFLAATYCYIAILGVCCERSG